MRLIQFVRTILVAFVYCCNGCWCMLLTVLPHHLAFSAEEIGRTPLKKQLRILATCPMFGQLLAMLYHFFNLLLLGILFFFLEGSLL